MEPNWKAKATAPIEKEIAELDKQIEALAAQKAAFEKALALFKGVANRAPTPGKTLGRPKKQAAESPFPAQNQAAG